MPNLRRNSIISVIVAAAGVAGYVYTPGAWNKVAKDGAPFQIQQPQDIRYGVAGAWTYKNNFTGPGRCTYSFFTAEAPASGVTPRCESKRGVPTTYNPQVTVPTIMNVGVAVAASGTWPTLQLARTTANIRTDAQDGYGTPSPAAASNWEQEGDQRTACNQSQFRFDDPIVYPGQPSASHFHSFFANTKLDAYTTVSTIRTLSGAGGSCLGGTVNLSGYWMPSILNMSDTGGTKGVPVEEKLLVYYKSGAWRYIGTNGRNNDGTKIPPDPMTQLPIGLRMISGVPTTTTPTGPGIWLCKFQDGNNLDIDPVTGQAFDIKAIPANCPVTADAGGGDTAHRMIIRGQMDYPQCWNGQLDSPNHRDHLAGMIVSPPATGPYQGNPTAFDGERIYHCPTTHPYVLVLISFFRDSSPSPTTRATKFVLSSDTYMIDSGTGLIDSTKAKTAGYSAHQDWMNGWDDAIITRWHQHCMTELERRNCGTGGLGDGYHLGPDYGNDGSYRPGYTLP